MKIFPGNAHIRFEKAKQQGIEVITKTKLHKHLGRVLESDRFKTGSKVLFFATAGIRIEDTCIIPEKDILIILGKKMKVLGKRLIVEAEREKKELGGKIVKSEAHLQLLPLGTVLEVGDEVTKIKKGNRIFFDKDKNQDVSPYDLIEGKKDLRLVKEEDVFVIL